MTIRCSGVEEQWNGPAYESVEWAQLDQSQQLSF